MALIVTARQSGNLGATSAQTLTTSSATPTASSLFLVFFGAENDNHATAAAFQTPTGGGWTYTQVNKVGDTVTYEWNGTTGFRIAQALYQAAIGGSPGAHTVVVDAYSTTNVGYHSAICLDVTGHNAGAPITQSAVNGANIATASDTASGTVTFAGSPAVGSLVVVSFYSGADTGGTMTAPTAGVGKTFNAVTVQTTSGFSLQGVWSRVWDGTESNTITCPDLGQQVGSYTAIAVEVASGSAISAEVPILNARPGRAWLRRFKHRQILAAAPVVAAGASGDGVVAQRSSTESTGIKSVSGASVAQQRSIITETGNTKAATGAGQSVARATTASTGQKNATGAAPTAQRSSTATTVRKNGSGTGVVQQRNSTRSTATKAASGAGTVQQRAIVQSTGSSTPPVGGVVVQRVTTTSTGIKNATGAGVTRCRTSTGSTGVHGGIGAGSAVARTRTTSTGVHRGTGTAVAVARTSSASTGIHRGTGTTAAATCRTSSQAIGIRSTSGPGRVQQRIIAIATGEQVAPFAPLLDPVGSARPNTAAARPHVNVGAATAENTAATAQRENLAAAAARNNPAEATT